ncbi:ATP-binding protein [Candidatus Palauibacter sp.]|uniref:ATP-binding protein n=1 Tax=Candidatus Palauibacter sp. TaxID=3101350 RepID=UPI003B0108BC
MSQSFGCSATRPAATASPPATVTSHGSWTNSPSPAGTGTYPKVVQRLARTRLFILDDLYARGGTRLASQVPVEHWHDVVGDPAFGDAILDRLLDNAHRITLKGASMRRLYDSRGRSVTAGRLQPSTPHPGSAMDLCSSNVIGMDRNHRSASSEYAPTHPWFLDQRARSVWVSRNDRGKLGHSAARSAPIRSMTSRSR